MTTTDAGYRIAEVARRSGFTTATLRYYEEAGLMPPAKRAPSGYRVYDDRAIDRLRFIARAKQLGCSLDEITDLVEAWDTYRCGPVKHRLRTLVAAKSGGAFARIADGVRVEFGSDAPLAELARLANAEHECCRFFRFAITVDARGVGFEVTAPDGAEELDATLVGADA